MFQSGDELPPANALPVINSRSAAGSINFQSDDTLSLQAEFNEIGMYTAMFWLDKTNDTGVASASPIVCEATIQWRVGGNTITRVIMVVDGVSISGLAESVTITVRDRTIRSAPPQNAPYFVSILVAQGSRPAHSNPPVLQADENSGGPVSIAIAGTASFTIPPKSGVKSVRGFVWGLAGVALSNDAVLIRQFAPGASDTIGANYDEGWIPICTDAETIFVDNNSGQIVNVTILYGIDG